MSAFRSRLLTMPLVAGALLRLALWAAVLLRTGTGALSGGDTLSYLEPGRNLLFHGAFQTAGLPEIGRAPGYPLFLALVSMPGLAVASLIQAVLSLLLIWQVARLARAAGAGDRAVLVAAWLMAMEPVTAIYSVRLLSETLFCMLLVASLEGLVRFLHGRSFGALALGGLALAAAVMVRPAAYYLPFLWALGLAVVLHRERGVRWKAPLLLLAVTVPFLVAWQLRNQVETGFSGFSSITVRNSYFYTAAEAEAASAGESFAQAQHRFGYPDEAAYVQAHPEQVKWSEVQRLAWMRGQARRILVEHWPAVLGAQLTGSAVVAFTPSIADLLEMLGADPARAPARVVHEGPLKAAWRVTRTEPWRTAAMAAFTVWLLALYALAVRGISRGRIPAPVLALLLGTALYFLAVSGGVQAVGRFRLPLMPVVCLLAGAGWAANPSRNQQRNG